MLPIFVLYLLWLSWMVAWFIATIAPLRGVRKLRLHEEALYRTVTLAAGALLFTITPWPGLDVQYRLWQRGIGDDLAWRLIWTVAVALSLAGWSLVHRHIAFRRGVSIVTGGPYALVRHPIYLGLIIAAFATAMLFGRLSSVIGATLLTFAFICKVVIEEQRTKGPAFAAYKRRALMFLPLLGFAWLTVMWLVQRLKAMARAEPEMPASRSITPTPVEVPPPLRAEQKAAISSPTLTPHRQLHCVAFEVVLADDDQVVAALQSES